MTATELDPAGGYPPFAMDLFRRSDVYVLDHLRNSLDKVERYTNGRPSSILLSPLVRDAVEFVLTSLAAATSALSPGVRARHPEVDWAEMGEMGRRLLEDLGDTDGTEVVAWLERYPSSLRDAVWGELEDWSWSEERFEPFRAPVPMEAVHAGRERILRAARSVGIGRIRVFPPDLGETPPGCDLILLVTPPDRRLLDGPALARTLTELESSLSELLGCRVQVTVDGEPAGGWPLFERRLREASVPV